MNKSTLRFGAGAVLAFLLAFTTMAFAATAVEPSNGSLLDYLKPVYDAFVHGHYMLAGMAALVFAVAVIKRYAPGVVGRWANRDPGSSVLVLLASFGTAMTASLAGGAGVTWVMLKAAAMIAAGAAGGYSLIKKVIIEPFLRPLAARAPAWAQPIFALVFWIFDKPSPVEVAEAAGDAAVEAKPAPGPGVKMEDVP